jgi:hypothetical protein
VKKAYMQQVRLLTINNVEGITFQVLIRSDAQIISQIDIGPSD